MHWHSSRLEEGGECSIAGQLLLCLVCLYHRPALTIQGLSRAAPRLLYASRKVENRAGSVQCTYEENRADDDGWLSWLAANECAACWVRGRSGISAQKIGNRSLSPTKWKILSLVTKETLVGVILNEDHAYCTRDWSRCRWHRPIYI